MPAGRLKEELGLAAVFSTAAGAMFSSGFFLLPGLVVAETGGISAVAAYFLASVLMIPAILSTAELASAMPRAGGSYFFLDRALGPLAGTIGGLGNWFVLVLKSAFALIGIGAYLEIFFAVPIRPLAIGCTVALVLLNLTGAKETTRLQGLLVAFLFASMAYFVVRGLWQAGAAQQLTAPLEDPWLPHGTAAFLSTVGMIFISYAGLGKVASIAEEVARPERNIPLGMFLALATVTTVYVLGVFVMVALIPADALPDDMAPVATAAATFRGGLPDAAVMALVVAAAVAAFISTANAGILSASRYPLAMARDHLLWARFAMFSRFHTPGPAIISTGGLVVAAMLLLDVESLAKLASTFQLLLFALLNLAVIIMRASHIGAYMPGYESPLYPYVQGIGIAVCLGLIAFMGLDSLLFSMALIGLSAAWYAVYGRPRTSRHGAVGWLASSLTPPARLDRDLLTMIEEEPLAADDPLEETVAELQLVECDPAESYRELVSEQLRRQLPADLLEALDVAVPAYVPNAPHPIAVLRVELAQEGFNLVLIRPRRPVPLLPGGSRKMEAFVVLAAALARHGSSRRMLGALIPRLRREAFWRYWPEADADRLRQVLSGQPEPARGSGS